MIRKIANPYANQGTVGASLQARAPAHRLQSSPRLQLARMFYKMDTLLQFRQSVASYQDANNNTFAKGDKYSLRPRSVRRVTEQIKTCPLDDEEDIKPSKISKPKQKAAPLSKYRRKTANARERNRMREINQAFETLRRVIPQMATTHQSTNEKLTKITTLRLAMKYISSLSAALTGNDVQTDLFSSDCSDLDCFFLESDGESLPLSDHSLLASPDFPESSLSPVDFGDPTLPPFLPGDFPEHPLESSDFSEFLLT